MPLIVADCNEILSWTREEHAPSRSGWRDMLGRLLPAQRHRVGTRRDPVAWRSLGCGPCGFRDALYELCASTVEVVRERDQHLALACCVTGPVPLAHHDAMLRGARSLLRHVVLHGLRLHLIGSIDVQVRCGPGSTELSIIDDGWADRSAATCREDFAEAELLARLNGGCLEVDSKWDCTVTTLWLPAPTSACRVAARQREEAQALQR